MTPTLLLADDSVTIQRVIELTFADEDVNVIAVSDGEEAIVMLERTPPDIVLADVDMPRRSGYEVAQHVKDTPRLAHIPVVLLTGAFERIDQAKADAAGCDGVLAKPFEPQLVIGRVRELLSKAKAGSTGATSPPAAGFSSGSPASDPEPSHETNDTEADDYFERLNQALTDFSARSRGGQRLPGVSPLDWFSSQDAPASAPAAVPFNAAGARTFGEEYGPLPTLADAFAALLAAEQSSPMPAAPPRCPSPPPVATAAVSDELVEQIIRRVLDELTDRVVRESVAERVGQIAERLVLEEIARIKGSIK